MNPVIQFKKATPLVLIALACFVVSPTSTAVSPPPDGGYPGFNTAEGTNALFTLTTGGWNTAIGGYALFSDTTGGANTALGTYALRSNATGSYNTATGVNALEFNMTGIYNTANGAHALLHNTAGFYNTAIGFDALGFNTAGNYNTADGAGALSSNTAGNYNTAIGYSALHRGGNNNTATGAYALQSNGGSGNTAYGYAALVSDPTGNHNTAYGANALALNDTGNNNIAVGFNAGANLMGPPFAGDNNIYIGNLGVTGEDNTIRIGGDTGYGLQTATFIAGISGTAVVGSTVVVDGNGQLGTFPSAARFKKESKPMDKASEAIHALKPVTFRYKQEIDPEGIPQFGLVAEEVAKVNPDLVVRDRNGEIYSVRYDAVNAMLLNEFLKEHRKVEELHKQIEALTAGLQKVSAQLEASKPAPQVVNNP